MTTEVKSTQLQDEERAVLIDIVQKNLGQDWTFEVSDGPKKIYAYPDFERKCMVICNLFFKRRGFDLSRKLLINMVATQLAVRDGGKATKATIAKALDKMQVPKSDRIKVKMG